MLQCELALYHNPKTLIIAYYESTLDHIYTRLAPTEKLMEKRFAHTT